MNKPIAIIGAGNGGQAFAGYLGLKGFDVKIFDVMPETVKALNEKGGVELVGNSDVTGFGKIVKASTDIGEVMEGAEVVLVVLPSIYHDSMAEKMAPYLRDGQLVLLNPAAPLGAISFANALEKAGCKANILLASAATLLFAVRIIENGKVNVTGQKVTVGAAAYPSKLNDKAQAMIKDIIPQITFGDDVIRNALDNLNAVLHPGPVLLNTGRIEGGCPFEYYIDMTPSQCKLIESLDKERMALGEAYGLKLRDFVTEFKGLYDTTSGDTVYEVLTNNKGYVGIKGPTTMNNRYVLEDVPYSLVSFHTLGKIAGVPTPCVDAVITIARQIHPDMEEGRSMSYLGLNGITKDEFLKKCRG